MIEETQNMSHKEIVWPQRLGLACMAAIILVGAYAVFGTQPLVLFLLAPLTLALCTFIQLDARLNREINT